MLATPAVVVRGRRPHGERPLDGGGSRVARHAAFWAREAASGPNPRNPLELVVTGRRRSGRPMAVSRCKASGFAARGRSPHTREVAGSNPAAPIGEDPATAGVTVDSRSRSAALVFRRWGVGALGRFISCSRVGVVSRFARRWCVGLVSRRRSLCRRHLSFGHAGALARLRLCRAGAVATFCHCPRSACRARPEQAEHRRLATAPCPSPLLPAERAQETSQRGNR